MRIKYVFWGYSDYMKVVNKDILYNKDVLYFAPNELSVRQKILFLSLYIDIYILYKQYMDMNKCILLYTNRMFVLLTFLFWNI